MNVLNIKGADRYVMNTEVKYFSSLSIYRDIYGELRCCPGTGYLSKSPSAWNQINPKHYRPCLETRIFSKKKAQSRCLPSLSRSLMSRNGEYHHDDIVHHCDQFITVVIEYFWAIRIEYVVETVLLEQCQIDHWLGVMQQAHFHFYAHLCLRDLSNRKNRFSSYSLIVCVLGLFDFSL